MQSIRLAAKAKRLTRKLLEATAVLFTLETVLGWCHKIIEPQHEGNRGEIICVERLGELLRSYLRDTA